jgi:hypothetical protein
MKSHQEYMPALGTTHDSSASTNPAVDNHRVPAIQRVIFHDSAYILLKRQVDMQYLRSDEL